MPVLNGYRGIAFLFVFIFHGVSDTPAEQAESINALYKDVMNSLWCGVDAFFVLSGFLIAGILLDSRDKPNYFRNFYTRRSLRIFPAYYVFLSVFLGILHPLIRSYEPPNHLDGNQIWYWFYLDNWRLMFEQVFLLGPIDHLWSLAVEEQFYLLCPLLIYWLPRKRLGFFLGIIILSVIGLRCWSIFTHPPSLAFSYSIYVNSLCRIDALAIGCLTALWVRSDQALPRLISISPIITALSGIGLGAIIITQRGLDLFNPIVQSIGFSILAIFFSSLLILSLAQTESNLIVRGLNWLPLQKLGTISYGCYIYHYPVLWILGDRIYRYVDHSFIIGHLANALVGGVLTLALALLSWFCLEKPFLQLKSYFPSQRDKQSVDNLTTCVSD